MSPKTQGQSHLPHSMKHFQYFHKQSRKGVALELHRENLIQRLAMRKEYSRQREGADLKIWRGGDVLGSVPEAQHGVRKGTAPC